MKRYIEGCLVAVLAVSVSSPTLAWSCASDEVLEAQVSPDERALISARIARQLARDEAMACIEAARTDCPELPDLNQPLVVPDGE